MGDRAGTVLQAWRTWLVQNNTDITVALLLVLGARRLATRSPFRTPISLTRVAPSPFPDAARPLQETPTFSTTAHLARVRRAGAVAREDWAWTAGRWGRLADDSGGALVATLSVWKFNDTSSAERCVQVLQTLQQQELIKVFDAATVVWEEGKKKPKTRQLNNLTGAGALGGAFWGLLFGLLFFVPLLGMAVGAATGALTGSLSDVGIDDNFINSVRDQVTPGTSALFVMTSDAVQDKVFAAVKDAGLHGELVRTNLSDEQETKLRETFSE